MSAKKPKADNPVSLTWTSTILRYCIVAKCGYRASGNGTSVRNEKKISRCARAIVSAKGQLLIETLEFRLFMFRKPPSRWVLFCQEIS